MTIAAFHTMASVMSVGLLLAAAASGVAAAAETGPAARRTLLEGERAAIEARYRSELAACESRFTVTACADEAKARRRQALEPIEHELTQLGDAERRRRAAERLKRIEEKRHEAAKRPAPPVEVLPKRAAPLPDAATRAGPGAASRAGSSAPAPRPGAAEAYERRQREADAHRRAVQKRNEERAARRTPAPPLPEAPAAGPTPR